LTFNFTPKQREEMVQCFGASFTDSLHVRLVSYAERWRLTNITLIEYYSVNCLFTCYSEHYGDCVLKIFGADYEWYIGEIRALREFNGQCRYVRAYEYDEELGALLLERIQPGTTLKMEPSIERRMSVFMDIWRNSHLSPHDIILYKSYLQAAEEAAEKTWACGENPELRSAAMLMISVCRNLYDRYSLRLLLHGDLHGDNLLKNAHGDYIIIDPHALIGPPICDLGRYIANEFGDSNKENSASITEFVISRLSYSLKLPRDDIIRIFFVDITLMTCWDAEDGTADLDGIRFAEKLLRFEVSL